MIANKFKISSGKGESKSPLVSFDKALLKAGVGNYNLVRLSSILPVGSVHADKVDLEEGSLLPIAYSTISSDIEGDILISTIGVGFPKDKSKVGVIMEYSTKNTTVASAMKTLNSMIEEAFEERGWELDRIESTYASARVPEKKHATTFACVAEWW